MFRSFCHPRNRRAQSAVVDQVGWWRGRPAPAGRDAATELPAGHPAQRDRGRVLLRWLLRGNRKNLACFD
jgi:hypothetical protein